MRKLGRIPCSLSLVVAVIAPWVALARSEPGRAAAAARRAPPTAHSPFTSGIRVCAEEKPKTGPGVEPRTLPPVPGSTTLVGFCGGLALRFDSCGIEVTPTGSEASCWSWRFRLSAFGREGSMESVGFASPECDGDEVRFRRDLVLESYRMAGTGIEQTFLLYEPPPGEGPIVLEAVVQSELEPMGIPAADRLTFSRTEVPALDYSGLVVRDATGRNLPARVEWHDGRLRIWVEDEGVYPLLVDPFIQPGSRA
jgi:hypothetical protein